MRKVIESTLVSLDGVIGEPHTWTGEHFGEDAVARSVRQLKRTDAMIMGRNTYEMFSAIWAEPDSEYSAAILNLDKYVFSTRLTDPGWPNTTVIREDVASFVRRLKEQDGQDIVLYGHGPVGQALLENGLLDELKLWVHPVVVGQGTLWFRDTRTTGLRLLNSEVTATGVAINSYAPLPAPDHSGASS
jgi:dihydrofolate reductase